MINVEMSHQDLDKEPITFHDFVAFFSEEELKLSHQWQKEIYRNVMKEFQRALISLGYTIHGTLLRMNGEEEEEVHIQDTKDSERSLDMIHSTSPCYPDLNPDISFRIKHEEEQDFRDQEAAEEMEMINSPNTELIIITSADQFNIKEEGEPFYEDSHDLGSKEIINSLPGDPHVSFGIKGDEKQHFKDPRDTERRENSDYLSTGDPHVSFGIKGNEKQHLKDPLDQDRRESSDYLSQEQVVIPPVQFRFKESESYIMDSQHSERRDSINNGRVDGSVNRKRIFGNPVKFHEKSAPCKSMARNIKAKVVQSIAERAPPVSQMWPTRDQELRGETSTQWQSDCYQSVQSNVHPSVPYVQRPAPSNGCESTARNVSELPCEQNTLPSVSLQARPEIDQTLPKNKGPIRHQRTHAEKGRYTYTQGEKSFAANLKPHKHDRTERTERPYHCTICGKSFNNNGVLIIHQRIHTGERPYQCNVCGTRFNQKGVLYRHQQIHTGERPYQCNLCEKSFSRKGSLIRHQTIHKKGWSAL